MRANAFRRGEGGGIPIIELFTVADRPLPLSVIPAPVRGPEKNHPPYADV